MKSISTRTVIAAVSYIAALALIGVMDFGERGYFFTPDAALASDPGDDDNHYSLRDLHLMNRSVGYVRSHYVDPERVNPQKMLTGAIDSIQRSIPEVMVKEKSSEKGLLDTATIQIGNEQKAFSLDNVTDLYQMTWKAKDIVAFLDQHLPDRVNRADVEYAAVNGMLGTLDPHSVLLNPDTYEEMRVGTRGKFGGLGIVVSSQNGELVVLTVLPDTPAAKAGLNNQDRITQIENESTLNMSLDEAVTRLRGEVKTSVTIWILREKWEEPKPFRIQREEIRIQAIQHSDLGRGVGYVRIKNFQQNTLSELNEALEKLEKSGALRTGLVLDLRNDPGGLLDQAVEVSDKFLSDGTIVTTVGGSAKVREEKKATRKDTLSNIPIVMLVNRGSASASEIVTGALKNNKRALVIGERTFGKGTVQVLYEIEDPRDKTAALKLTIAQYLTPGDQSIQSVGILPDLYMFSTSIDENNIDLSFNREEVIGESNLDNHLKADGEDQKMPLKFLRYYESPMDASEEEGKDEENPVNPFAEVQTDYQMILARDLLVNAQNEKEKPGNLLEKTTGFLKNETLRQEERIKNRLHELDVKWDPKPKGVETPDSAKVTVTLTTDREGTEILAGEELTLKATVRNEGKTPLYQLRGQSSSPYSRLDDLEWVFGTIQPGETRSWKVEVPLPRNAMARVAPVEIQFFSDETPLENLTSKTEVQIQPLKRPAFAFTYRLEDAQGNGDGLLQAGEDVNLVLHVKNVGEGQAFKTRAYVKNLSGEDVFLEKGRGKVESLKPGTSSALHYQFRVKKDLDEAHVELEAEITDTVLRATLSTPLRIPLHPDSVGQFKAEERRMITKEQTPIFSGASQGSPRIGEMAKSKPVRALGTFGNWTQIRGENPDINGWVASIHLQEDGKEEKVPEAISITEWTAISPVFSLTDDWLDLRKVSTEEISLKGSVIFPQVPTDKSGQIYIFNGDQKVFYQEGVPEKGEKALTLSFEATIPLEPENNTLVLYARQGDHIMTRRHLVIWRNKD